MNKEIADARKIYVDSNIIIYYIEGQEDHQRLAGEFFEYVDGAGIPLVTSEITVGECLYGAYKRDRIDSVGKFEEIFDDLELFQFVPIEPELIKDAARIGAADRMKLIDAIHVASASDVGCDVLVTNDKGIRSSGDLRIVQLSDL